MADTSTNQAFIDFSNSQAFINSTNLAESAPVKSFDDLMNKAVNAIAAPLDKGSEALRNMEASPSIMSAGNSDPMGRLSDSLRKEAVPVNVAKNEPEPQLGMKIEQHQGVQSALASANLPYPPKGQAVQATHIDNTDLHIVASSSKTTGLGGQVQTQEQGMMMG